MKVPPALAAEWRRRLAASGFEDIEDADGELKEPGFVLRQRLRRPLSVGVAEYYRRAGMWTHDAIWPSRLHRRLWELHSEGVDGGEMPRRMGPSAGRHHRRVFDRLRELRADMLERGEVPCDPQPESLLAAEVATFPTFDRGSAALGTQRAGDVHNRTTERSRW